MSEQRMSFATTCWSDVINAARQDGTSRASLERLCSQYWYPLYAFLRRSGHPPEAAEDYVQGFFADLLERESLRAADPDRGRFRTFLLTACKNYVANRQRSERAVRRGGGRGHCSLSALDGEARYRAERSDSWTPETLFERKWALAVIQAALERLSQRYADMGRKDYFEALRSTIAPASQPPTYEAIAREVGTTVGAVKTAVHRLRRQYAAALREEIAATVDSDSSDSDPSAIDDELQLLLNALRGDT